MQCHLGSSILKIKNVYFVFDGSFAVRKIVRSQIVFLVTVEGLGHLSYVFTG